LLFVIQLVTTTVRARPAKATFPMIWFLLVGVGPGNIPVTLGIIVRVHTMDVTVTIVNH
jgi:hypothetical protein